MPGNFLSKLARFGPIIIVFSEDLLLSYVNKVRTFGLKDDDYPSLTIHSLLFPLGQYFVSALSGVADFPHLLPPSSSSTQ